MEVLNRRGYTLLELILVIGLIGLALSLGFLNLSVFKKSREIKEVENFVKDLNSIRTQAILEGKYYRVKINKESNKYTVFKGMTKVREGHFQSGIRITSSNLGIDLDFHSHGVPSKAGYILFQGDYIKRRVTIQPVTGVITIYVE